jgi:hypothetical protein
LVGTAQGPEAYLLHSRVCGRKGGDEEDDDDNGVGGPYPPRFGKVNDTPLCNPQEMRGTPAAVESIVDKAPARETEKERVLGGPKREEMSWAG